MTNSPWEIQEQRPRTYFAEIFGEAVQKVKGGALYDPDTHGPAKSNSNPDGINVYWAITIGTTPLEVGDTYQTNYFGFGRDWNDFVLPSLHALVRAGKLSNPGEIFGKFAKYRLDVWRDYSKNTVQHYEMNNADKLRADENGKFFVERKAHVFEDVYSTREAALAASDAFYGVENDDPDELFGNGTANGTDTARATAAKFLEPHVRNARNGNSGVDREKLAQAIANDAGLSEHFTVDSPEVKAVIEKVEASPPF